MLHQVGTVPTKTVQLKYMNIKYEFLIDLLKTWIWRMELDKHNFTLVIEILFNTGIITKDQADEAYELCDKISDYK